MLLTPVDDIPEGKDWNYEVKYDGFRCIIEWSEKTPSLISRNGNSLNKMFPEIIAYCHEIYMEIKPFLPIIFDGEIVHLTNNVQSDFSIVQSRGRMKNATVIQQHAETFPCHYIIFDLLKEKGKDITSQSLSKRKMALQTFVEEVHIPNSVTYTDPNRLQLIDAYADFNKVWQEIKVGLGEGLVAKRTGSDWESGKRSTNWLKIKNWRIVHVILRMYDKSNDYFVGSIYRDDSLIEIVSFKHGLSDDELQTLKTLFQQKGYQRSPTIWEIDPSICVEIACIDFDGKHLREPRFHAFSLEKNPLECTWRTLIRELHPLPKHVEITHPMKPIWPEIEYTKDDYLYYLQKVSPYLLPFLKDRLLTVIRYPHGVTVRSNDFFKSMHLIILQILFKQN